MYYIENNAWPNLKIQFFDKIHLELYTITQS